MSAVVTQWFGSSEKPAARGVFEVCCKGGLFSRYRWYSYWNGKEWRYLSHLGPHHAFLARGKQTCAVISRWRGLADKP